MSTQAKNSAMLSKVTGIVAIVAMAFFAFAAKGTVSTPPKVALHFPIPRLMRLWPRYAANKLLSSQAAAFGAFKLFSSMLKA